MRELGASCRGNNDDLSLAAYAAWQRGEPPNPDPKFDFVKDLSADSAELLAALPFTISLPDYGVVVVHAGLVPGLALRAQELVALTTMRVLFQEPDHT